MTKRKPSTPYVAKLRRARKAEGLKRIEVYAYEPDREALRQYAETLRRSREKAHNLG